MCVCLVKVAENSPEGKPVEASTSSFSEAHSSEDPAETLKDFDGENKPEVKQREASEPQQIETSHFSSRQDTKTAETGELQSRESPRSASPTLKVMLKYSCSDAPMKEGGRHFILGHFISRPIEMKPVTWSHLQMEKKKQLLLSNRWHKPCRRYRNKRAGLF